MTVSNSLGNVAAGDARTASAGARLLSQGGNAVDAAVGAMFTAFTVEPVLTAPFGGGFGMVAGPTQPPIAYDFFADIPGRGLPPAQHLPELDFKGIEVSFGPTTQLFHAGRGAVAAPLLLPGLVQLHAEHGHLALAKVLEPAIEWAEQGVALSQQVASIAEILTPILTLTPPTAQLFAPSLKSGNVYRSPDLAALLRDVARGELQSAYDALLESFGPPTGRLTAADLNARQVRTYPPVMVALGRYSVALTPPPSLGGLLIALGLHVLKDTPPSVWQDEVQTFCHLLACMAVTQAARVQHIDPAVCQGSHALAELAPCFLAPEHVARWHGSMAQAVQHRSLPAAFEQTHLGSTTHVSSMDAQGMACCITSSNGEGCGHLAAHTGVMANNFLGEADINPAGFHQRPAGERLTSMMCPTLVLEKGRPILALGTGGSNRIRTALLQVLVHHLLRGLSLEAAVHMPRLHYEGGPLFVEREVFQCHLSQSTLEALQAQVKTLVYFDSPNMFFGGVHAAASDGHGVGDARRGGTSAQGKVGF